MLPLLITFFSWNNLIIPNYCMPRISRHKYYALPPNPVSWWLRLINPKKTGGLLHTTIIWQQVYRASKNFVTCNLPKNITP